MQVHASRRFHARPLILIGLAAWAAGSARGDTGLPPPVVAQFTRTVQPLLLNKCGQGACHGGPQATPVPWKLVRLPGGRSPDRTTTLANLAALLAVVGPDRDPQPLVTSLAARHPPDAPPGSLVASPLTARERRTLETWLAGVRSAEAGARRPLVDPAVVPAGFSEPGAGIARVPPTDSVPRPNRFQALLDAAANPPELPPPQEPQGIIFKKDDPEAE